MIDGWQRASPFGILGKIVDLIRGPLVARLLATRNAVLVREAEKGCPAARLLQEDQRADRPARVWQATFVAVAMILVSGCILDNTPGIQFVNASDQHVDVIMIGTAGREVILHHQLDPGTGFTEINVLPCTADTLIARNKAGEEVDRRDDRLCGGDTWLIGDPGSPWHRPPKRPARTP